MAVMAGSRRTKKPTKRTSRSEVERPTGMEALIAAYSHPLRIRILSAMNAPERHYSPARLAEEFFEDGSLVAYHFRELRALGLLEIVEENKVRGTVEKVHAPTTVALAWEREWAQIPAVFKQHIAALTTRLGFEALGAAIDDGSFGKRDDGVVAQDTMRVDERGASEALKALEDTVGTLMKIGREASKRLEKEEEDGLLVSYMTIGYEGAIRPL